MKKTIKHICSVLAAVMLMIPVSAVGGALTQAAGAAPTTSLAASREEVVYANLTPGGETKEVYVVNILNVPRAGTISDYGAYDLVKNLTSTEEIDISDDMITVSAPAGSFYYQGTLPDMDLPWNIDISYFLDGIELAPVELAGKDGLLEIKIATTPGSDAFAAFYDNYMLQISVTLDSSKTSNISAPGGTVVNAGMNKLVTYIVMPGNSGEISLSADVTDFSMEGIELAALPFSISFDTPDQQGMTSDLTALSDAISSINSGVLELKNGSSVLKNGAFELQDGSVSFLGGLNEMKGGGDGLAAGSSEIKEAINTLSSSLNGASGDLDLSSLSRLPSVLRQLASALGEVSSGLNDIESGFENASSALDASVSQIPNDTITQEEMAALYLAAPQQKTVIDELAGYYAAGRAVKETYNAVRPAFESVGTSIDSVIGSLNEVSDSLTSIAVQIESAPDDTTALMAQLVGGLDALAKSYDGFHSGLVYYTEGVSALATNYASLNSGIYGIANGVNEFDGAIGSLHDGTSQLYSETKDLPEKIDSQIDEMISEYDSSDFEPVSFVSGENVNTISVQFVMKTDNIEKVQTSVVTDVQIEKENFWTRLLDIFR